MSNQGIGSNYYWLNPVITASEYTEVTTTYPIRGFRVRCRQNVPVRIKRLSTDTVYGTIYPRESFPADVFITSNSPSLGWFLSESGSVTLEIFVIY